MAIVPFSIGDNPLKSYVKNLIYISRGDNLLDYQAQGIKWWNYAGKDGKLINTYPQYMASVKDLNLTKESRNHVITLWDNSMIMDKSFSSQAPCISQIQVLINKGKFDLIITQRSGDAMLGVPADVYQMWLLSEYFRKKYDLKLNMIHWNFGSLHIYNNHILETKKWLKKWNKCSKTKYNFKLNT